jgi:hypothetical protein
VWGDPAGRAGVADRVVGSLRVRLFGLEWRLWPVVGPLDFGGCGRV